MTTHSLAAEGKGDEDREWFGHWRPSPGARRFDTHVAQHSSPSRPQLSAMAPDSLDDLGRSSSEMEVIWAPP